MAKTELADPRRFTSIEGAVIRWEKGWSNSPSVKCAMDVQDDLSGEAIVNLPAAGLELRAGARVRITIEIIDR
jgi:hypothetical protein